MTDPSRPWRAHAPFLLLIAGAMTVQIALGGFGAVGTIRDALPDPALTRPLGLGFALLWLGYLALAIVEVTPAARGARLYTAALLAVFFLMPVVLSVDLLDYIRRGRIWSVHGANPHLTPATSFPEDPFYGPTGWTFLVTPYGPAFTLLSGVLTWIAGDGVLANIAAFKLATTAAHVANGQLVRSITGSERSRLLYLCNPFILLEVIGSAHNDVFPVTAALASILCLARGSTTISAALLGVAVWIKIPFAVLLPLWMRYTLAARPRASAVRDTLRGTVAVALVSAALWLPFWAGPGVFHVYRVHAGMLTKWSMPAVLGASLARAGVLHADLVASLLCLAVAAVVALPGLWRAREWGQYPHSVAVVLLVVPLLSMGWLLPWYFVWPLSFVPLVSAPSWTAAGLALTAGGLANYVQQTQLGFASTLAENALLCATSIAPPFVVLAFVRLRSGRRLDA